MGIGTGETEGPSFTETDRERSKPDTIAPFRLRRLLLWSSGRGSFDPPLLLRVGVRGRGLGGTRREVLVETDPRSRRGLRTESPDRHLPTHRSLLLSRGRKCRERSPDGVRTGRSPVLPQSRAEGEMQRHGSETPVYILTERLRVKGVGTLLSTDGSRVPKHVCRTRVHYFLTGIMCL